jgi:parvulin-like peptidyl-prolyl isomerase
MLRALTVRFLAATTLLGGCVCTLGAQTSQNNPGLKAVATVNGESIAQWELDMALAHAPKPPMGLSDVQKKVVQRQLLALMIDELLLQQFLKKNVPAPEPAVIQQRMAELEKSLAAKQKTLADYCKDTGQTEPQLRTRITTVVQWNAYARKKVSDEDAKRYYEANKDMFDGITVRASHVFLKLSANADAKQQQTVLQQLQTIQREALQGRDFAELAKKYSQDDATAARGGDLGYFPQRAADPDPFVRTASTMRVGQLSEPVRTDYGYHLIKLTDRKAGKPTTYDEMKEESRLMCVDDLRLSVITEQRKAAKIEVFLP